jgi:amphiphysin
MQLNIFYTLHEKMQQCDIGYFNLTLDIEEAFEQKRGDIQEQAEKLTIVRFKTSGRQKPPKYGPKPAALALESSSEPAGLLTQGPSPSPSPAASFKYGQQAQEQSEAVENPPPPYSAGALPTKPPLSPSFASAASPALAAAAAGKPKPPPPKPKPSRLGGAPAVETVTALYDYSAQAEGDLSFRAGDVIEIVSRTQNENEWWTGKINGRQGQFPGKFCLVSRTIKPR